MRYIQLITLAALMGTGCNGDTDTDTDIDTDTDTDTDTDIEEVKITIEGSAIDLLTQEAVAEGLCAAIIDPTPAVTGGESITLGGGVIGADGAFSVSDIPNEAPFGLFVSITDCEDATEATVWASLTGILAPQYQNLSNGDTLTVPAVSVSLYMLNDVLKPSLTAVGETKDIETLGAMIGWVNDASGTGVTGATVSCTGCGSFYYADTDAEDGLFSTGMEVNAATSAVAGGMFLLPEPITAQYAAEADNGMEWEPFLFGGSPGVATFAAFTAKAE
jgi:hypothetical protein